MEVRTRTRGLSRAEEELGYSTSISPVDRLSPIGYLLTLLGKEKDRTIHLPSQEAPVLPSKKGLLRILFSPKTDSENLHDSIWNVRQLNVERGATGVSICFVDPTFQKVEFKWAYSNDELSISSSKQLIKTSESENLQIQIAILTRIEHFGTFHI